MSMMKCDSCGKEISKQAKSCPQCGHSYDKPDKSTVLDTNIGCGGFIVLVLVFSFIYSSCSDSTTDSTPSKPKTQQELRLEEIKSGFSAWDGSHRELERMVKNNLRDPDSYEHIETRYGDKGDYILVSMKYRARNGFGGMNVNTVTARASIDGQVLEIISQ